MSEKVNPSVVVGTKMRCDKIATQDLVAMYMFVTMNQGTANPKECFWYENVKDLFTEFDGTKMHADTLAVVDAIVAERLGV